MVPPEGEDGYRVQLFNTRGGSDDGEVLPAVASDLLPFERDDMTAFVQVSKAVQEALKKQASEASVAT